MGDLISKLRGALGDRVVTDEEVLATRRHDYWVASYVRDHVGEGAPQPACVVRPKGVADVQALLSIANETKTPVIPFGLGSGVCGGVVTAPDAILLDMSAMNATRAIDSENLLGSFDAGKNGLEAENEVAEKGLTIGHWPQSVGVSSVGGWIATRASGQFSTAYGNIENIVHSIEAVLPDGSLVNLGKGPRSAAGPDLRHVMLGSEGTLGVITGVTYSLRRGAEARALSCFFTKDMRNGFEFQREVIQSGWAPPVMRQYDEKETNRLDPDAKDCTLILVHEGPKALVEAEKAAVAGIAKRFKLETGPECVVEHWLSHRNTVPSWDMFLQRNIVLDTVEIAADWTKIGDIYGDATKSLNEMEGVLAGTAHSSHVYRSGLNLYFTFAVMVPDPKVMEATYHDGWQRIMEATDKHGGSLAHHHGIGRVRRNWLTAELGGTGVALLRKIKGALDPNGIMNPGVLLPDA